MFKMWRRIRSRKKEQDIDLWEVIKRQKPLSQRYWTVQEFLEFYEVLKVANLLEIYYDACPDFRRIAIRLYNLFGKE